MLLASWDGIAWQDAALVAAIAVIAYLLVMWVAAVVWVYRDARSRTHDNFTQTIALVLVLVFSLPGLLVYLVLRPKNTLADAYDRQLEAEALLHELQEQSACPMCRRKVEHDFVACPYCRSPLREPCGECGKPMATTWVICPYCGADRPVAAVAAPAMPARPSAEPPGARPKRASTATYTPPAPATPPEASADAGS